MNPKTKGFSFALSLGLAVMGLGLLSSPASANSHDKQWKRGCADAQAGTYDRAKHNDSYEKGWQACKSN